MSEKTDLWTAQQSAGDGPEPRTRERPILFSGPMVRAILDGRKTQTRRVITPQPDGDFPFRQRCPYGKPGDRLWVRETWTHEDSWCSGVDCEQPSHVYHRATESYPDSMRWRPSIFMPRWASRIDLEVVSVRVERLQEIGEDDAKAEGVEPSRAGQDERGPVKTYRTGFVRAWDTINGKRAPWVSNPWVWVVEFREVQP